MEQCWWRRLWRLQGEVSVFLSIFGPLPVWFMSSIGCVSICFRLFLTCLSFVKLDPYHMIKLQAEKNLLLSGSRRGDRRGLRESLLFSGPPLSSVVRSVVAAYLSAWGLLCSWWCCFTNVLQVMEWLWHWLVAAVSCPSFFQLGLEAFIGFSISWFSDIEVCSAGLEQFSQGTDSKPSSICVWSFIASKVMSFKKLPEASYSKDDLGVLGIQENKENFMVSGSSSTATNNKQFQKN